MLFPDPKVSYAAAWRLAPRDSSAIANARVLLALIRVVRRFPGLLERRSADDVGEAFAPVLAEMPKDLAAAMKVKHREVLAQKHSELVDGEAFQNPLSDRTGLQYIGEGLAHQHPAFRKLFDRVESRLFRFVRKHSHPVDGNVTILRKLLSLSDDEAEFMRFAGVISYGGINKQVFDFVSGRSRLLRASGALLNNSGIGVDRIFDRDGTLANCGIFENIRGMSNCDLADILALTPLGDRLLSVPYKNARDMAQAVLQPLAKSAAPLAWPHLLVQQELLESALRSCLESRAPGINVLLHGAPGTGKTEFARQIVNRIQAKGYSVADQDERGREASREERLTSLTLSQLFAGNEEPAVLVLDEAEDIFQDEHTSLFGPPRRQRTETKAWMNKLLENNRHPVIWISNRVEHLDPAYLRRFSFCIEFPRTPKRIRRQIAADYLRPLGCGGPIIDSVAAREHATPGLVASAARFAALASCCTHSPETAVITALDQHLVAAGRAAPPLLPARSTRFDLRFLNVRGGTSPESLIAALEVCQTGTALLFGPPGTGKTQLAAEIATRLGRELVYRTASDINTMWFGQSERNVARLFRECDTESEILFLDEAEILLGSRAEPGSRAIAAVTAEFLRWLEAFRGVFLCASNHASAFDAALARRFVFRLEFLPLTLAQRSDLLMETAGVETLEAGQVAALGRLDGLTPGDFANVVKRFRATQAKADLATWLNELEGELRARPDFSRGKLGFV